MITKKCLTSDKQGIYFWRFNNEVMLYYKQYVILFWKEYKV